MPGMPCCSESARRASISLTVPLSTSCDKRGAGVADRFCARSAASSSCCDTSFRWSSILPSGRFSSLDMLSLALTLEYLGRPIAHNRTKRGEPNRLRPLRHESEGGVGPLRVATLLDRLPRAPGEVAVE